MNTNSFLLFVFTLFSFQKEIEENTYFKFVIQDFLHNHYFVMSLEKEKFTKRAGLFIKEESIIQCNAFYSLNTYWLSTIWSFMACNSLLSP